MAVDSVAICVTEFCISLEPRDYGILILQMAKVLRKAG